MSVKTDIAGVVIDGARYEVRSKLGEGSMGLVYRAFDARLQTEVVLKVPTAATLSDPEFAERFQREIRSLVQLKHPHIVTIHDVGDHEGVPYVVMQYLSGGSLRDRIYEGSQQVAQPPASLQDWLMNVARALDFIHQQHFIHRDVKPANILFDQFGNAYLSDFGLAKALSASQEEPAKRDASLTAAGFLVGTPNYVAPELIMGHVHDGRVDQYSLAMTVYECLAGCVPVEGPTASATMVNQTGMKIPPLSKYQANLSDRLSEAVIKGLAKNQARRYANCVEFAEAVLEAASQRSSSRLAASGTVTLPTSSMVAEREAATSARSGSVTPLPANIASQRMAKISRGTPGNVPCPECGKVLPLKPQFAGKKARCAKCLSLLLIGPDIASLKWIAPPPNREPEEDDLPQAPLSSAPKVRRQKEGQASTSRNAQSKTAKSRQLSDSEIDALLGEEVFGWRFSKKAIAIVGGSVLIVTLMACVLIGWWFNAQELKSENRCASRHLEIAKSTRDRIPAEKRIKSHHRG